jgi:hypothetical protein
MHRFDATDIVTSIVEAATAIVKATSIVEAATIVGAIAIVKATTAATHLHILQRLILLLLMDKTRSAHPVFGRSGETIASLC